MPANGRWDLIRRLKDKQGVGNMSTAILATMGHASVASLYSNKSG